MKIDYHSLHEKGRKTTNNYKYKRIFTQKWDLAGVFYRVFVRAHTYCIWWQVIAQQMYRFIIINTACVSQHKLIRNVMNGCNCCHFNSLFLSIRKIGKNIIWIIAFYLVWKKHACGPHDAVAWTCIHSWKTKRWKTINTQILNCRSSFTSGIHSRV